MGRKPGTPNPWLWHVKAYWKKHPELAYRQAMVACRPSYDLEHARAEYIAESDDDEEEDAQHNHQASGAKRSETGAGILGDLFSKAKRAVTSRLEARPLNIINMLKAYGSKQIVKITVCKTPIISAVKGLLNVLSAGDLAKTVQEKGYDNVFHLFARLELEGGTIIRIEKNQRVSIALGELKLSPQARCESATLPQPTTLQEFIDRGEALGNSHGSFWRYSGYEDNCQKFIRDLLNGSGETKLDGFIMQDAGALIKSGFLRGLTKLATDIAAGADYVWRGGHDDHRPCEHCENAPHMRKVFMAYKKAITKQLGKGVTTDTQLSDMGKHLFGKDFRGVFSQDTLPVGKNGLYIVNVDTSEMKGSHWVGVVETPEKIYVYDSFARHLSDLMPILEAKLVKKQIDVHEKLDHPTQWGASNLCGQNSLSFICVAHEFGPEAAMHF